MENRYAEQVLSNTRHGFSEEKLDEDVMLLLFRCIDRLPERCREIFLLHLDGLSNEEIAKQLNLSVLTVKTQKRNAMKVLRDHFRQRPLSPSEFSCIFLLLAYLSCERLSF